MKNEFWIHKWQNNQTGFHKSEVHPLLIEYIDKLNISKGDTVFVPLCGKSLDLLWLNSQGFKVVGIELSELAIEQLFSENNLTYNKSKQGVFNVYTFENIKIYQGDFFEFCQEFTKDVKAVYDRAALIALPDGLVEKYVDKMYKLLPQASKIILVTLELIRTATDALGPPFSFSDEKTRGLFGQYCSVELLQTENIIKRESGFQKLGCEYVYERVYLIEK